MTDGALFPAQEPAFTDMVRDLYGARTVMCTVDGPTVRGDREAVDIIGYALQEEASLVVMPVARLDMRFFDLRTGVAGEVVGKFASYRIRLAIVGDISEHLEHSSALRALVYESNRGHQLWFVDDIAELERRLGRHSQPQRP
jgi:Domain of unknown function (DUF4180)